VIERRIGFLGELNNDDRRPVDDIAGTRNIATE
jgi:hypothetical protein